MLYALPLVLFALDAPAPALSAPLVLHTEAALAHAPRFELRAPSLARVGSRGGRGRLLAQSERRRTPVAVAPAEVGGVCEISCEQCRENDAQARDVLRRRQRAISMHRAFAVATWSSLLVTEVFGTIAALNQDTWFGRGPCASGRPDEAIFGRYGCSGIQSVHLTFSFLSTGLYATTGVLAATAPDPERVGEGDSARARRLRVHRALTWVHAAGMILMPILGVLAANPEVVFGAGDGSEAERADFSRAMRSMHQIVGYTTFGAYTVAAVYGLL